MSVNLKIMSKGHCYLLSAVSSHSSALFLRLWEGRDWSPGYPARAYSGGHQVQTPGHQLTVRQVIKSRDDFGGQGIEVLFRKPED